MSLKYINFVLKCNLFMLVNIVLRCILIWKVKYLLFVLMKVVVNLSFLFDYCNLRSSNEVFWLELFLFGILNDEILIFI